MKPLSPPYFSATSAGAARCCTTGYPVLADPLTRKVVCSCQMQSGIPAYLARVPTLPENFYAPGNSELYKTTAGNKMTIPSVSSPSAAASTIHPYYIEQMMAAQSYGMVYPGIDINSIRRKNTNREATGPLKSWLYQHRKNPYPTKAEKIMLAIISQMTLTQVSTWFANARRRLKKETKMEDKDLDLSEIDVDDSGSCNESFSSRLADFDSETNQDKNVRLSNTTTDCSDISDAEDLSPRDRKCVNGLLSPDIRNDICLERNSSPEVLNFCSKDKRKGAENREISKSIKIKDSKSTTGANCENKTESLRKNDIAQPNAAKPVSKPKIWSIASMI